jgi:hypothetical protein
MGVHERLKSQTSRLYRAYITVILKYLQNQVDVDWIYLAQDGVQ